MNLIGRYISAVAQHLPASRRDDITRELRANILDRLEGLAEEQQRPITVDDEAAVLQDLGHPQQVAASFLPPKTLVNALWFPTFTQCLIYGLIFVLVIQAIGFSVTFISLGKLHMGQLILGFLQSSLLMFASVTGVFYLLSNLPATARISPYSCWNPKLLPPVEHPWQRIKPLDSASEFANNLFFLLLLQYPLWMPSDLLTKLPVSIGTGLQPWVLPLTLWTLVAIGFNLWSLRYGYWSAGKLWFSISLNLAGAVLAAGMLFVSDEMIHIDRPIPQFISEHLQYVIHWAIAFSFGLYVFWAARSSYRLHLLKRR